MQYKFEEYYFIGKPREENVIDYYFYSPEYDIDKWDELNLKDLDEETLLFSGRWRGIGWSPRRHYNQEMESLAALFIIHKDARVEDIIKDYACSTEEATAIVDVIGIHKKEKYKLDFLVELMWRKLNLIEKVSVGIKESK